MFAILRFTSVGTKCLFGSACESGIHIFVVKFKDVTDVQIWKKCSESLKMMKESMSASKPNVSQTIPKKKVMSRCSVSSKSVHDVNKASLSSSSWIIRKFLSMIVI